MVGYSALGVRRDLYQHQDTSVGELLDESRAYSVGTVQRVLASNGTDSYPLDECRANEFRADNTGNRVSARQGRTGP